MRISRSSPELISAIVEALGVNGSGTARKTLTEVVEGTFETDNNRVATLATLETVVAHLSTEYEDLIFRCLTTPEELRPPGKSGQAGQPGRPGYGPGSGQPYGPTPAQPYGPGPGQPYGPGHPSMGAQAGTGPLTAVELQQHAFSLIQPKASEQFRVRLAGYLATPDTPREDHQLFGTFLCKLHPDNLAAQAILYQAPGINAETKTLLEDNFLALASEALGGVLGIPAEQREAAAARRSARRQAGTGPGGGMYPGRPPAGQPAMPGMPQPAMPGMPQPAMPGMPQPAMPGAPQPAMPGMPQPAMPGAPGGPSTYGGPGTAPGQLAETVEEAWRDDPDLPYRLARKMWGPEVSTLIQSRLSQVSSLKTDAPLVLLASTIPVDSVRLTLYQVLRQQWEDGPSALESAGLFDEVVSDPGFLMLVKMLPREEPKQEAAVDPSRLNRMRRGRMRPGQMQPGGMQPGAMQPGRMQPGAMQPDAMQPGAMQPGRMQPGAMQPGAMQPGAMPPGGMPPGGMQPGAQGFGESPDMTPGLAWMFASEDLLRVFCERLFIAAKARSRAFGALGAPAGDELPNHGLPFELREDATVVAEYHLDWPTGEKEKLPDVPLGRLKLHYVRAEQTSKITTLGAFYRRKLDSPTIRQIENGTWLESFGSVPQTDWKRSIDLTLTTTTAVAIGPVDKKAEIPVTTDILCIAIKDPEATGGGK